MVLGDVHLHRLESDADSVTGYVRVFNDGAWGSVCDDGWTDEAASVVCKQLDIR